MQFTRFTHDDRQFTFTSPVEFFIKEVEGLYLAECQEFSLLAFTTEQENLIPEIACQIAFLWDCYMVCHECELANDALQLKQQLMNKGFKCNEYQPT